MQVRINVLPPGKKELIRRDRWFLLLSVQCLQLAMLSMLVAVMAYGIHWMLAEQSWNIESGLENSTGNLIAAQIAAYQTEAVDMNRTVGETEKMERSHLYWSELFLRLEQLLPEGVFLRSVGTKDYRVSLSGQASDRDTLLLFRDRLSEQDCFSDIQMPLSNLFVQERVDFQMDFTVKETCIKGLSL